MELDDPPGQRHRREINRPTITLQDDDRPSRLGHDVTAAKNHFAEDRGDALEEDDEQDAEVSSVLSLLSLTDAPRDYVHAALTLHNFYRMSMLFSAVHAAALACLSFATARLGPTVSAWQSGVLYLAYTGTAVCLGATYIVKRYGSKASMLFGTALFNLYVGAFAVVTVIGHAHPDGDESRATTIIALTGAALGGVGAGLMWTAQGVYFSQAAEAYSLEAGMAWEGSTSKLAGIFAFFVLAEETVLEALATVLIRVFGIPWRLIFVLYTLISVVATLGITTLFEYPTEQQDDAVEDDSSHHHHQRRLSSSARSSFFYKATATFQLLIRDSKMKYMIGLNAAFGFAGAFLNSFVSGYVEPVALDDPSASYVGLMVAFHGAVAAVCSLFFGRLTQRIGKVPVLIAGAVAFCMVGFPFLIQPDPEQWTWPALLLVYSSEGVGRATFEGTLKAVFADYFPYEKEGAFGNIILQNGLSSGIAYILTSMLTLAEFAGVLVTISLVAVLFLWRASCLDASAGRGGGGGETQVVREYRTSSIASYRRRSLVSSTSSPSSASVMRRTTPFDRRTYDALSTTIAQQDSIENNVSAVAMVKEQYPQIT